MNQLGVWMNGERVGTWTISRTRAHSFQYASDWADHPKSRPLSLSLPITADGKLTGDVVENYFDNLLPDNEAIRKRLSGRHRTKGIDAFSLLKEIGRDCVGAVQLLPPDAPAPDVQRLDHEPLTQKKIESMLSGLGSMTGVGAQDDEDEFRISIAGAQEKTALLKVGQRWCRPRGATPTTHILKPPIGITPGRNLDLSSSPENEWLCSRIIAALGLPVANCHVEDFGARRALVINRFDRQWQSDPKWIARLPQEDFCQILGQPSSRKYQDKGGPSMDDCLRVLQGGSKYEQDAKTFLLAQLSFWLLAAIDGHAKNFSVFLLPKGAYHLTPIYDVMSAWPIIDKGPNSLQYKKTKLAMAVRGTSMHYKLAEIHPRHWEAVAVRSGVSTMWDDMNDLVARLPGALSTVAQELPASFPKQIADTILDGALRHARRFQSGD